MAQALGAFGVDILYDVAPRSLVIGYALGVLLTLVVVAVSAWRERAQHHDGRSQPAGAAAPALAPTVDRCRRRAGRRRRPDRGRNLASGGDAVHARGLPGHRRPVSPRPGNRRVGPHGLYDGGLALVAFQLAPLGTWDFITDFSNDMSVFLVGGLLLVVGATWTIIYNAPLLLGGLAWAFGHSRSLAPVVRLSIAYPLRSLFGPA